MSVAIIGGLDRLKRFYEKRGKEMGFDKVKVFSRRVPRLGKRLSSFDGIVIFTGTVAHPMVEDALRVARKSNIPVGRTHNSGVSAMCRCLREMNPA